VVYVFQVVLARALDDEVFHRGSVAGFGER
jgi:hypothetical protein